MIVSENKTLDLHVAIIALASFIPVALMFFPVLSYFLSIFCLIAFNTYSRNPAVRWYFILNAVFSLSVIYLSRNFLDELDHDLFWYYSEYLKISSGDKEGYNLFGGGVELGYHYFYGIVAKIFPELSSINLAFVNFIVVVFLFLSWLEIFIIRDKKFRIDSGLIYGLSIMFIGFVTFGYLQRQSLAFVILLYALTSKTTINIILFTLLSAFFHLTAFPIIVFYLIIRKFSLTKSKMLLALTLVVPLLLLIRMFFYSLIDLVSVRGIEFPGVHKLGFYLNIGFSILSLKDLLINLSFLSVLIVRWDFVNKEWRNIALASFILYFVFLGIPLLSERINFLLFFLYGFFAYLIFIKNNRNYLSVFVFKCFFIMYLCVFCFKNISMVSMEDYEYWNRYPFFNFEPFYYLSGL